MSTLRDFKARQAMLLIEQQRRTRQAHRDELDLAYQASRDPRPRTMQEQEMEYALVRTHRINNYA